MVSITTVVWIVLYIVIGGMVFGLLNLLIDRAPFMPPEWKPVAKFFLLALAILVLIGILLSLMNGTPLFRS